MVDSLSGECRPIEAVLVGSVIRQAEMRFACEALGVNGQSLGHSNRGQEAVAAFLSNVVTLESGHWIVSSFRDRFSPQIETTWVWGNHGWKDPCIPVFVMERMRNVLPDMCKRLNPFVLQVCGDVSSSILID
jgi:hypothetical protein